MRSSSEQPEGRSPTVESMAESFPKVTSRQAVSSLAVLRALQANRTSSDLGDNDDLLLTTAGAGARFQAGAHTPDTEAEAGAIARDAA